MKRTWNDLATFVRLHDGYHKPKLNFQAMYKLFPNYSFDALPSFGAYYNYNQAFGYKDYSMKVTDINNNICYMTYKEYQDADENTAYITG